MTGEILILAALGLPLLTAVGIAALGNFPNFREAVTLAGSAALFALIVILSVQVFGGARPTLFLGETAPGLAFAFRLEPLGALFALVASGLWIVNSLFSIGYMRGNRERNQTRFYICFALAMFGVLGVAFAENLFTLFVAYEIITLSTYPLVVHKGDDAAQRGGVIYGLTLFGTSIAFFLTGLLWTWALAGRSLEFIDGGLLASVGVDTTTASILLTLFVFGVGKAALMPFHFWLPNAMVAPTPVSAFLHAVAVVKAGVFTLLKISIGIFGLDLLAATPARDVLLGVASFTIIAAGLIALTHDNLKARLAWSTIAQLAYVTVGVLLAVDAGFIGGALQLAAHAVGKMTLFMCAGAIYVATGLTHVSDLRGLGTKMPWVFIAFLIGALSIVGLPPFAGAWPKFFLFQAALDSRHTYIVGVLIIGALLSLAALLPIPLQALMPPPGSAPPKPFKRPGGAPALTVAAPVITAVLCIALFFASGLLVDVLTPALGTPAPLEAPP
jgi:multicomponent Na+:H+ antiporter subunit D